jgi:hypothetical protein
MEQPDRGEVPGPSQNVIDKLETEPTAFLDQHGALEYLDSRIEAIDSFLHRGLVDSSNTTDL